MLKCKDCGHTGYWFMGASIDANAIVNDNNEFIDWEHVNFDEPAFDNLKVCPKCWCEDLIEVEVEENE